MINTAVFDVDGTICFDGRTIELPVVDALRSLRTTMRLAFASARPIRDLLPVLPPEFHDEILIGGNGAFTRVDGRLDVLGFADADRRALDALIDRHRLRVLVDGDWDYCFTGDQAHKIFRQLDAGHLARNVVRETIDTYSKVVLFTDDPAVIDELSATSLAYTVHDDERIIDIAPSGITKHQALNRLGIADGRYLAFGNDANDMEMLRHAAVSYGVGQHPALDFVEHRIARVDVAEAIAGLVAGAGVQPRPTAVAPTVRVDSAND